jgi:hypothetical protein
LLYWYWLIWRLTTISRCWESRRVCQRSIPIWD